MKKEDNNNPVAAVKIAPAKTLELVVVPKHSMDAAVIRDQGLDAHAAAIAQWYGVEKLKLSQVRKRLKRIGVEVSIKTLREWWEAGGIRHLQTLLLEQIHLGVENYREVKRQLAENPPPEMETLIELIRMFIFNKCVEFQKDPTLAKLITAMMKTVMDWAHLQEKVKLRELAQKRFKESMRKKLAAGLEHLAEAVGGNPKAREAYEQFRAIVLNSTK